MSVIRRTADKEGLGKGKYAIIDSPDGVIPAIAMRMNSGWMPRKYMISAMRGLQAEEARRSAVKQRLQQKVYIQRLLRDGPPPHPADYSSSSAAATSSTSS